MAGRPRKPTVLKLVTGTAQPCRINAKEPKPQRARPSPPEHISAKARTAWGYVSSLLDRMGVLTESDGLALEGLCEAYADMLAARQALEDRGEGLTYETTTKIGGRMIRSFPEVAMAAEADRRLAYWLGRFGLTPADRSRVSANADHGVVNPFAEFA